jgi:hypothetical protein
MAGHECADVEQPCQRWLDAALHARRARVREFARHGGDTRVWTVAV